MREVVEDLETSYCRQADAEDCFNNNTANVMFLEDQIQSLQRKLAIKQQETQRMEQEITSSLHVLELSKRATLGLYLR